MRVALKFTIAFTFILTFLAISFSLGLIIPDPYRRKLRLRLTSWYCGKLAMFFGMEVVARDFNTVRHNHLIVSNHLSYLDVIALSTQLTAVYVTSEEVKQSGLLGWLCRAGGCLFVERRSRSSLKSEVDSIAGRLKEGFSVVVFPEATTSDGTAMHPFRTSLFGAAEQAEVDVIPICINYLEVDGKPLDRANADVVYFHGEMTFFAHFFRFLKTRRTRVEIRQLPTLSLEHHPDRKRVADAAYQAIQNAYKPLN